MSWISFLDKYARLLPEKNAIINQDDGKNYTYTQLHHEVLKWINTLKKESLVPGDRVAYYSTNSLEHLTIFFACAKLGLVFVPLNFRLSEGEIRELIHIISPKKIYYKETSLFAKDANAINIESITFPKERWPYYPLFDQVDDTLPCLILFTSGSTGTPKGVMLTGKMIHTNQVGTCLNWKLKTEDKTMVETPFFHTGGYNVLCLPLLFLGGTIVLAKKFCLDNFYQTLKKHNISVYFGVPTMFQSIAEDKRFSQTDFSSLRFLISGGAPCSEKLIHIYQQKNLQFKQGFGLTEVGPNCFVLDEKNALSKIGSIGRPMPHTDAIILKDDNSLAKNFETGELLLKGDHLCLGFYKNELEFQSRLYNGYYRTGDLVYQDDDGHFFVKGRKKDMYISGGENVYPAEVEKKICQHPDIAEAVVVSVSDIKWGEVGAAFIRSSRDITLEEMKLHLSGILSNYKRPHYLKKVDAFPLLPNGKINKIQLKTIAGELFQ